jgi:peptide/nickel transport system ATP-binding protein
MALIARPSLLIADEPTTALDVTTQAQILDLVSELKRELAMTMLFITHDLGVVAEIADDVVVMRNGHVLEHGGVDQIFHDPQHEYTKELLASLPQRSVPAAPTARPDEDEDADGGTSADAEVRSREVHESSADTGTVRHHESSRRTLLAVEDLRMEFDAVSGSMFSRSKERITAVDGVSLEIPEGSTFGLVGESGCGKTTLGRCIMRAYTPTSGRILYDPEEGTDAVDLAQLSSNGLMPYRRAIRMVFQDPYGSLNPRMTVRQVIGEPLRAAKIAYGSELDARVADMLEKVGLDTSMAGRYPHAFSGGERQRIGIARALITGPKLVIADEAVSALDVSVRTQILELLSGLQEELGLTYLFISHDLSVVERICDRVAVMYYGNLVEEGPAASLFADPQHGYTRALLSAVPVADPRLRGSRERVRYVPAEAS